MVSVNRRGFLKGSLASAASAGPLLSAPFAAAARGIVDTHVYVSRWPTRRMKGDQTPELVEILRNRGIAEAWAGSFEALLFKDTAGVNARLADECERHGQGVLVPFGAIHPKLPGWEENLRRCQERHRMPGIRLHPNYHNYTLRDPDFLRVLEAASGRGMIVQIAAWMEDERCHVPLMRVPSVDLSPLPGLLEKFPSAKIMVLNGFISPRNREQMLAQITRSTNVTFDFAMLDGLEGVRKLAGLLGMERIVFGSYSPMFYVESALLKVQESALTAAECGLVYSANARRLLPRRP